MILTRPDILAAHARGDITIEPFDPTLLQPNSVDVRLGQWYYRMNPPPWGPMQVVGLDVPAREMYGEPVDAAASPSRAILLGPGDRVLAHTEEAIGGQGDVVAMLEGKSTFGRRFISVHQTAGVGDIGYRSRWTLEIANLSRWPQALHVGEPIAQVVFYRASCALAERDEYHGRYRVSPATWSPLAMLPKEAVRK